MNTIKSLTKLLFAGLFVAVAVTACKEDDFTEEDLLNLQLRQDSIEAARNAARAAEALNQAGELLSYSVTVISVNNEPVEGAEVTLIAASADTSSSSVATQTVTTGAMGQANFDRAIVGGNTIMISADGYFDIVASVNFGNINNGGYDNNSNIIRYYTTINGEVIPTPVSHNSIIPLFQDGGDNFATINGRVTIQTDLTNDTTEVPQDIVIQANLNTDNFTPGGSAILSVYSFAGNENIGSGAVDNATGEFQIMVPALPSGITTSFIVPEYTADQTLYVLNDDNQPELVQVPTLFGPNVTEDAIPAVPSYYFEFSEPDATGAGLGFTFTKEGRSVPIATIDLDDTDPEENTDVIFRVTNQGSADFENSPLVTITDAGSGTGAEAEAHIEYSHITGLTVAEAGSGFGANAFVNFDLVYNEVFYTTSPAGVTTTDTAGVSTVFFGVLTVQADASGEITQDSVNSALADALENVPNMWFNTSNTLQINDWVSDLRLVATGGTTDAELTPATAGWVHEVVITDGGEDYTDPSIALSGGGGTTVPVITISEFGTQWNIAVDNSGVTEAYNVLPEGITFEAREVAVGSDNVLSSTTVERVSDGTPTASVIDALEITDDGIAFNDISGYRTTFRSEEMPRAVVQEPQTVTASATIIPSFDDNGSLTNTFITTWNSGSGYTDRFTINVVDAFSGSGAAVEPTGGSFSTSGEYIWGGGLNIVSEGSGYDSNLNEVTSVETFSNPLGTTSLTSGQVMNVVIRYGTGDKLVD